MFQRDTLAFAEGRTMWSPKSFGLGQLLATCEEIELIAGLIVDVKMYYSIKTRSNEVCETNETVGVLQTVLAPNVVCEKGQLNEWSQKQKFGQEKRLRFSWKVAKLFANRNIWGYFETFSNWISI